jgi:hypothetical protein
MSMTVYTIDHSTEGTTLVSGGGTLTRIDFLLGIRTGLNRCVLSLVDDAATGWPPKTIWRQDLTSDPTVAPKYRSATSTNWGDINHTSAWCLMADGNIPFQNLTVLQVPIGSRFELTVS